MCSMHNRWWQCQYLKKRSRNNYDMCIIIHPLLFTILSTVIIKQKPPLNLHWISALFFSGYFNKKRFFLQLVKILFKNAIYVILVIISDVLCNILNINLIWFIIRIWRNVSCNYIKNGILGNWILLSVFENNTVTSESDVLSAFFIWIFITLNRKKHLQSFFCIILKIIVKFSLIP